MLRRPGDEEQSSEENWLQAYWTGEASSFTGGGGGGGRVIFESLHKGRQFVGEGAQQQRNKPPLTKMQLD